jgi:hypothetical protein
MGCANSAPPQPLYETPTLVVDVGGGSLVIYLNGVKVASPAYYNDEYAKMIAEKDWDVRPLIQTITQHVMNIVRARKWSHHGSGHDTPTVKGQAFVIKVGITGDGRTKLDMTELIQRVQNMNLQMQAMSNWAGQDCGILPFDMESSLEQRSAWAILDPIFPNRKCIIFNMGGSDCRIFSKEFAVELKSKGCKYTKSSESYPTGPMAPGTFKASISSQRDVSVAVGSKEKIMLVFCGFYGYFFSMIYFRPLWKSIIRGKPISLSKMRKRLAKLIEQIDCAEHRLKEAGEEGFTSDMVSKTSSTRGYSRDMEAAKVDKQAVELLMNNKDKGAPTEVLCSKRHLCQYASLFIESVAEKVADKNVAGVLIDNKLGAHVKKHVSKDYIKAFNQHSQYSYENLDT